MKTIYKGSGATVTLYWKIMRGENKVTEDLSNLKSRVFLIGSCNTYSMEPDVVTDEEFGNKVLKVEVDASMLCTGVYDVKAVWEKNDGRNIMKSARTGVFAITDNIEEVDEIKSEEVIRIVSYVESIGRDGLSAYEIAVIRGLNNGLSENDWVGNEAERIKAEQERASAEITRNANETARTNEEGRRQSRFNAFMEDSIEEFDAAQENRSTDFISAQTGRETAFTEKIQDFEDRFKKAEANRNNGEETRNTNYAEAEDKRDNDYATAEANRDKKYGQAEATRNSTIDSKLSDIELVFKDAEDARKTIFNDNEDSRQTNEQYRIQAEGKREKDFQDNEQRREQTFQDNEVARQSNEVKREKQESIRQQAEQARIDTFDENERGRIATFNANETTRQSNETKREDAESKREAAETIRQQSYADKVPMSAIVQTTGDSESTVMSQKAVSEEIKEINNGYNKSAQIPYSFERQYNGYSAVVRTNKFSPCTVYGIIVNASKAGLVEVYSHSYTQKTYQKIEQFNVKKSGFHIVKLTSPFDVTEDIGLGISSGVIGIRSSSNVLGMYETSKDNNNLIDYNDYEAVYGVITSQMLLDSLLKLQDTARLSASYVKTNNAIDTNLEYSLGTTQHRANNFQGEAIGIRIYATKEGFVNYGILKSDYTYSEIGSVHLNEGFNNIYFDDVIECGSSQQIYLNNKSAKVGITGSGGVGMWDAEQKNIYQDFEMAYWLIEDLGTQLLTKEVMDIKGQLIGIHSSIISTGNPIENINQYKNGAVYKRANDFVGLAEGLRIMALGDGTIEYGIIDVPDKTSEVKGTIEVVKGLHVYRLSEPIDCTKDEKLYIYSGEQNIIGAISTNGIGMYQLLDDGSFAKFDGWELSYELISNFGLEGKIQEVSGRVDALTKSIENNGDSSYLKYGEIVLPNKVHIAAGSECNLWWSSIANIEEGDKSIYFETVCDIGRNTERGFVISADDSTNNIGSHLLRIVSRRVEDREKISDVTINIDVVSNAIGSGDKNILMMGDSRTWQSFGGTNGTESFSNFVKGENKTITTEVKKLTDESQGAKLIFVGHMVSNADSNIRNCAESGQGYTYPIQKFSAAGGVVSYVQGNGLQNGTLDFATIMYGINDLSDWNTNVVGQFDNSVAKINSIISNAKKLVDTILSSYPSCKVILVLEPTTCASQDGWAYWAGNQTKRHSMIEMEKAEKYLRKVIIETFDNGRYNSNVILSSAGLWCDRLYGYPYIVGKMSRRCSAKTKEIFQECVHPFDDGYKQIADGIFGTIKYLLK